METFLCNYCNKKFINKYTLKTHIESSVKCISIRKKESDKIVIEEKKTILEEKELKKSESSRNLNDINIVDIGSSIKKELINKDLVLYKNTKCNYCNKEFYNIYNLERHLNKCSVKNIYVDKNLYQNYIDKIKLLEEQNNELNIKYNELNIKYNHLEEKYLSLQYKPNIINNFHSNNIINNNKSNLSIINHLTPLTDSHIREKASLLQTKDIIKGAESLAIFARDHSFKDRVICTDVTRRNFIFKDENNNIIKDPKGVKITKKFIENNKPELINLLTQYSLTFYNENSFMDIKHKLEIDHCLDAIRSGDISYNVHKYNNFEKIFTTCFGKFVFNKEYNIVDNNLCLDTMEEQSQIELKKNE